MGGRARVLALIAFAFIAVALLVPASAVADTGNIIEKSPTSEPAASSGWQAGTCTAEPAEPGKCSIATPSLFFEQASGHPNWGFTQFIVKNHPLFVGPVEVPGTKVPEGEVKTIRVDLPVGFSVNGDGGATFPAPTVAAEVSRAVAGDIVIAHANHPRGGTAVGIKAAVPVLRRRGLKFLRLSDVAPAAASAPAPAKS